jgi:hypothetical protein
LTVQGVVMVVIVRVGMEVDTRGILATAMSPPCCSRRAGGEPVARRRRSSRRARRSSRLARVRQGAA